MFRNAIVAIAAVLVAVVFVGCRSSSSYLIENSDNIEGMEVYHWTSRENSQEIADGQREIIFNRHLDRSLKAFDQADTPDKVKDAQERVNALSSTIHAARPQRKMVQAVLSNYLDFDVVCRIYPTGSNVQHVSVMVPAGKSVNAPLREGVRYTAVFVRQTGYGAESTVYTHAFSQSAYDGIPTWVGFKS
ncbi:MAG: hypothetical protein PHI63_06005 [Patescibacteria group bacterium]|nr:hypothetical protein [Patescibacteria group bacterium]